MSPRTQSWASWVYTSQCTYISPSLPIHPPPSVPRCPFSTLLWFFWSFLQLVHISLSWVGCLSPFRLFLLELYLAASLQHVSVTSFCLTCCFYFVFSTDSLVTCSDLTKWPFVGVVLYLPAVHSPRVARPKCCNVCSCEGLFFVAGYVGGLKLGWPPVWRLPAAGWWDRVMKWLTVEPIGIPGIVLVTVE